MGYIGLPTACMLSNNGFKVLGVDVNEDIIHKLQNKKLHIEEPELEQIFLKALDKKTLQVSKDVEKADIYIIAVPTPLNKEKRAELKYIRNAAEMIKNFVGRNTLVILESTSPPGTTRNIVGDIITKHSSLIAGKDYYLAFCPERVLPGKIIFELINNDRVIGGINHKSAEYARDMYRSFVKGNMFLTSLETSEFVKLAENTFRDVNIAFANELSVICDKYDINIWDIIKFANMHPRVNILNPGPGVGGHCIAIDPWFILENIDLKDTLIEKSRMVNDYRPVYISEKIIKICKNIKNPKVTFFGLSYKENVGDLRESPALRIIDELKKKNIKISAFDPLIITNNDDIMLSSMDDALKDSDLLLLFVGHDLFKKISFTKIHSYMRTKNIFDTRNFYDAKEVKKAGFTYFRI